MGLERAAAQLNGANARARAGACCSEGDIAGYGHLATGTDGERAGSIGTDYQSARDSQFRIEAGRIAGDAHGAQAADLVADPAIASVVEQCAIGDGQFARAGAADKQSRLLGAGQGDRGPGGPDRAVEMHSAHRAVGACDVHCHAGNQSPVIDVQRRVTGGADVQVHAGPRPRRAGAGDGGGGM